MEAKRISKTHYTGFPASIEPCAVSMCGAGGSPHSVGRGQLDAQLVVLHAFPHQVAERMHGALRRNQNTLHQLSNESRTHEPCMYTQSKYANLQSPLTPENEQPAE